jgi:hypothetical protein
MLRHLVLAPALVVCFISVAYADEPWVLNAPDRADRRPDVTLEDAARGGPVERTCMRMASETRAALETQMTKLIGAARVEPNMQQHADAIGMWAGTPGDGCTTDLSGGGNHDLSTSGEVGAAKLDTSAMERSGEVAANELKARTTAAQLYELEGAEGLKARPCPLCGKATLVEGRKRTRRIMTMSGARASPALARRRWRRRSAGGGSHRGARRAAPHAQATASGAHGAAYGIASRLVKCIRRGEPSRRALHSR